MFKLSQLLNRLKIKYQSLHLWKYDKFLNEYPNYRYFERLLSRLTPAVSGEIFG